MRLDKRGVGGGEVAPDDALNKNYSDPGLGGTTVASITVTPVNDPPVVEAGGPYTITEGDALHLDQASATDVDGDTLTYEWDLDNDGVFGEAGEPTTATPSVPWATLRDVGIVDDGTYTIALRVSDGSVTVTDTASLTVLNAPPAIVVSGATSTTAGATYTLSFAASDPGEDTITAWRVEWGDGTADTLPGDATSAPHVYATPGLSANGALAGAAGATVGPDGHLYVSGYDANRVLRYDGTTGAFLDTFVSGLNGPTGVTFNAAGQLLVGEWFGGRVGLYDGDTGAAINAAFAVPPSGGAFAGLGFGADGRLYVGDGLNNRLLA